MQSPPRVLIHILNFNKKDLLMDCISSVLNLNYKAFDLEVVDNASSDGSVAQVRALYPDIHIIQSDENRGVAGGRNFGLREAGDLKPYQYLFFLDDDAEVEAGSLGHLVEALEADPEAGIACGTAVTAFPPQTLMSCGIDVNLFLARCTDMQSGRPYQEKKRESTYVDACGGFAFFVRRDLFERLRFFDEGYSPYGWEDVDVCLRARRLGFRTKYVPEALVCHKGTRLGRKPVPAYEKSKVRSFLRLVQRHANPLEKIGCAIFVPLRGALLVGRFLLKGEWKTLSAMLRSLHQRHHP